MNSTSVQSKSGLVALDSLRAEKIRAFHRERLAVVYVRQSTVQQVLEHQESTRLQYGLVSRAEALGWATERVLVIDDDLGKSGASAQNRAGFQRLVSEVSLDHVGIIFGVEMSRLARSNKDWHQLLELCALFHTLIADLDGIYDPAQYHDRLLLGLKGTMSEAELHILKQRMYQGRLSKAQRGELQFALPVGYVWSSTGEIQFDPDEQVQQVVRLIFRTFLRPGHLGRAGPLPGPPPDPARSARAGGPWQRGTALAPPQSGNVTNHAQASPLCGLLRLRATTGRSPSQAAGATTHWSCGDGDGRVAGPAAQSLPGLHFPGAV